MSAPREAPKTAMVLAAGIGSRMRPLTDDRPKALIEVGGKCLIDHTLDRLAQAGVERCVVNVHHFADMMADHLAKRTDLDIVISDERAGLLDSAGGISLALPYLWYAPVFVANIDNVWIERGTPALTALAQQWNPDVMDICILLAARADTYGYGRPEGFLRDDAGRLTHSTAPAPPTPYANVGVQILKPQILDGGPTSGGFSIVPTWHRLSAERRLFGAVTTAEVIHVSDPAGRDYANRRLAEAGA